MLLTDDGKNAMLQGLADKLNVGTNSQLSIYVGVTLAAELVLTNPVQLSITGGVLTFKVPPEALAVASGVPTTAKLINSSGVLLAEFDAALITLDKDKIYQGGYVGVTSIRFII